MIQSSPVWSNATRLTLCLHSTIGQKRFCSAQIFSASYLNGGTTSRCLTAMIPKVWGRLPVQGRNYFRGCTATHIKFFQTTGVTLFMWTAVTPRTPVLLSPCLLHLCLSFDPPAPLLLRCGRVCDGCVCRGVFEHPGEFPLFL